MSVRDLELFQWLVRTGSLSHTGSELSMSPTAINRWLSAFEDKLKIRLFHRLSGRLELTTEGRAFQKQADQILAHLDLRLPMPTTYPGNDNSPGRSIGDEKTAITSQAEVLQVQ